MSVNDCKKRSVEDGGGHRGGRGRYKITIYIIIDFYCLKVKIRLFNISTSINGSTSLQNNSMFILPHKKIRASLTFLASLYEQLNWRSNFPDFQNSIVSFFPWFFVFVQFSIFFFWFYRKLINIKLPSVKYLQPERWVIRSELNNKHSRFWKKKKIHCSKSMSFKNKNIIY